MNTETGLFELILFDIIIVLVFLCFLLTAVFFPSNNLFIILLSLVFGIGTLPFAGNLGRWLALIRYQEKEILSGHTKKAGNLAKWIPDMGIKGNTRMFRMVSGVTVVFSVYDLIRYVIER